MAQNDLPPEAIVFDRALLRRRRDRLAAKPADPGLDYLFAEAGERLLDRLSDVTHKFPLALDLGSRDGWIGRNLAGRGGIEQLIQSDLSPANARRSGAGAIAADEERLPFADASLDLVLSNLALHWVNDLPGALIQVARSLKPDGLFLAVMFGGDTLTELRQSLIAAESEIMGGASPRVSPFADLRDAAGLLQRAGFALPVADIETLTVTYPDPFRLMAELRGMGEANALMHRQRRPTRRKVMLRAAALYAERFPAAEGGGRIRATFQLLFLTGWTPHAGQQQPARRGSGRIGLASVLAGGEPTKPDQG